MTSAPRQTNNSRGIGATDVDLAADALLRKGERPTIERVRARIGRGSPNTINPLLDAWWRRLAGRLDAGPTALHRLPEPVLLAAEGLWMQTLDEARRRAAAEQGTRKTSLARDRQDLEIRSHVLSIRESEMADLLRRSEGQIAKQAIEIESLVTMLRKEQASRAAAELRLAKAQGALRKLLISAGRRHGVTSARRVAEPRKSTKTHARVRVTTGRKTSIRKSRRQ